MGVSGTDPLTAAVTVGTSVATVTNNDKYSLGGVVAFTDAAGLVVDDNGGDGYTITDVSTITEQITVSSVLVVGAPVDGFVIPLDFGGSIEGNPLETRHSTVEIDGIVKPIIGFTFVVADEPEYLTREKTPSGYPESYAEVVREISGEVVLAFRRDEAVQFKKAIEGTTQLIKLLVGNLEGYMIEIPLPRASIDVPVLNEETPIVEMTIKYTAIATTGEDSNKVIYK